MKTLLFSFLLHLLACSLTLVGMAIPAWWIQTSGDTRMGLYEYCGRNGCGAFPGTVYGPKVARTIATLSAMLLVLPLVFIFRAIFKTHRILLKTTVMLDVLVWISMISVLVFASRYQETVSYNVTLGYAFILYVLGFIFYFAAGVVTMVALSRYETK
eukprot:Rmarinus@m.6457